MGIIECMLEICALKAYIMNISFKIALSGVLYLSLNFLYAAWGTFDDSIVCLGNSSSIKNKNHCS